VEAAKLTMAQPVITAKFLPSLVSLTPEQARGLIPQRKKAERTPLQAMGLLALVVIPAAFVVPWALKKYKGR